MRLAGEDRKDAKGKPQPRTNNTVRLDLAFLGHMFTIAIREWGVNLPSNPVLRTFAGLHLVLAEIDVLPLMRSRVC